jgi:hypothetical protein
LIWAGNLLVEPVVNFDKWINSLLFDAHKDANIVNDEPAVSQEIIVVQTSKAFLYKLNKAKTYN